MLLTILFYIFLCVVGIQLFFYVFFFTKFTRAKIKKTATEAPPISVVIAARNEAENLKSNLTSVLKQNYPHFEVILVNDASTDQSSEVLKNFKKEHTHLHILNILKTDSYSGNKKNALSKGIEMAHHDYLLFTDADCKAASADWISTVASHFDSRKSIVLGYGAYEKRRNSFLNKLIRYETLLTAIQYFSYAKMGIPYMGVGRNLAYKKELYLKNNGFNNHQHVKSGDDDLLINEISNATNVEICFNKKSFTISQPKETFTSWFQQKRRHISTATKYKANHQFLLGLFFISQFLFWSLAIILLIFMFNWQIVTILIAIRLISQYIVIQNSANKLNEKDIVVFTAVFDFLLVFVQCILFFINSISKPKHW